MSVAILAGAAKWNRLNVTFRLAIQNKATNGSIFVATYVAIADYKIWMPF